MIVDSYIDSYIQAEMHAMTMHILLRYKMVFSCAVRTDMTQNPRDVNEWTCLQICGVLKLVNADGHLHSYVNPMVNTSVRCCLHIII